MSLLYTLSCFPSQGAKLFYLSGLIHGQYPRAEISNLARFISVMKFHPLDWRSAHPYVVADRMEDLTNPEEVRREPKCDRTISLYGYVRGTNLLPGSSVHIPGTCEQVALGRGSSGEGGLWGGGSSGEGGALVRGGGALGRECYYLLCSLPLI